ncbi:MAG: RNA polymerase sigma factor (sigma-70 family) [Kiritimatiellia bacterium]|jgi:RNA polymerase sigma factor (sigma-70 family)
MEDTRVTLLNRLKQGQDIDWTEFYATYEHAILAYARNLGLDQDGAYDVLQESMVIMVRIIQTFEYDRSQGQFRNFLLTIVHRNCLKAFRRRSKEQELHNQLGPIGALGSPQEEEPDLHQQQMWQTALLEQAVSNIRKDPSIKKQTMEIFTDYVIKGMPPSEVASKYRVAENNVYQIKKRMIKQLKKRVDELRYDA